MKKQTSEMEIIANKEKVHEAARQVGGLWFATGGLQNRTRKLARAGWPPVFINKVLLDHSPAAPFTFSLGSCLCAKMAELSGCNRLGDGTAHRAENISSLNVHLDGTKRTTRKS